MMAGSAGSVEAVSTMAATPSAKMRQCGFT